MQDELMKFDPATGEQRPYPSHAKQWRTWHGNGVAWLINPWTGCRRDARDVGSDVAGHLIVPPGVLGGDICGGCLPQNMAAPNAQVQAAGGGVMPPVAPETES